MSSDDSANTPVYVSGRKTPPFAQAAHWVLVSDEISPSAKALYAVLCGLLAKGERDTFASREALAGILGCSDRSVWTWTKELVKINAITVEVHKNRDGRANVYHVHELPPPGYEGVMSLWAKRDEVVSGIADRKKAKTKDGESPSSPGVRQNLPDPNQNGETEGGPAKSAGGVRQYLPEGSGNICRPPNNGVQEPSKTPPVGVDERSVREPAVREHEDPIDESPDFVPHADRVAVEAIQEQFAAEPAPNVETTRGGDKKQKNPNHYDTAADLLREAFAGVDTGDAADTVKRKRILVDALAKKLAAGVTKQAARDNLGRLSAAKSPLGAAMYRIESLKPVTGATGEPRPDWCGQCPETTRMVYSEDKDRMARCPNCHPKANDPERRSPISGYDDDDVTWKKDIESQREFSRKIREDIQRQKERRKNQQAAM